MIEAPTDKRFERLTGILERYITRSTAGAMLRTVMADRGIDAGQMTADDLALLVEDVMVGLRLFCNPARLPDLMIDLAELCDREVEIDDEEPPSQRASSVQMKPGC